MAHLGVIWIISLGNLPIFSTIDDQEVIYPCLFAFNFSSIISITLQCALTFVVERKIVLVGDACSRPPITIKSHDLHVGDIKGAVAEITSYHEKDLLFPFLVNWSSFGLPFLSPL
jgi:hypothetical protein